MARFTGTMSKFTSLWGTRQSRRQLVGRLVGGGLSLGVLGLGSSRARAADEFDVVVVGSGAAGMTAALAAAKRGLSVLIIDKASHFGGSTARSGGGIWIRGNGVLQQAGVVDDLDLARTYLASLAGPGVSAARQEAFLANGPAMISFITQHTPLRFRWMEGYPDYYPELPGGQPGGASIEPEQLDGRILGSELARLNPPYIPTPPGVVIYGADYRWLTLVAVTARGVAVAAQAAARYAGSLLRREKPLTMGQALAAGLRAGLMAAEVPLWLDTPLVDLVIDEGGRVQGVTVNRRGQTVTIRARRGVIVASGGFEHNLAMRRAFQPQPITTDWTVGAASNTGDGILAGRKVGAALGLMDEAWWGPTLPLPGQPYFCLAERSLPGSLMVNGAGVRFVNEAAPYVDVVKAMYGEKAAVPAWLITDHGYRCRYLFKNVAPALPLPKEWYESGVVFRDTSIEGLAAQIGVPAAALRETIERFNAQAAQGLDPDFHRGESAYDRYYADPTIKPNPNLAPLGRPPYYAFKLVPGDLGTKGGLMTDERARVLREDGTVIAGLYAAGNASASVMGPSYPGAGATLGPAMTFGYIAAHELAESPV